jgi:hypothetical protein
MHVSLLSGGELITGNVLYFTEPKNMTLPDVDIQLSLTATEDGYMLSMASDKLVKNLFIDIPDPDAFLSDNYFDLLPGQNKEVKIKTTQALTQNDLKIKHLNKKKLTAKERHVMRQVTQKRNFKNFARHCEKLCAPLRLKNEKNFAKLSAIHGDPLR